MNVVYVTDESYSRYALVSFSSLCREYPSASPLAVYIVHTGLSSEIIHKFKGLATRYKVELNFVTAPDLSNYKTSESHGNPIIYLRLMLDRILPDYVQRVLCLDCDTLVMQSLFELEDFDFCGHICAGVSDPMPQSHLDKLGLRDAYINMGVLLIDLQAWRTSRVTELCLETLEKNQDAKFADQDVLNISLQGAIKILHPHYNVTTQMLEQPNPLWISLYTHRPDLYTSAEYYEAINCPRVIHFTRGTLIQRPWEKNSKHTYKEAWQHVRFVSDIWREDAPSTQNFLRRTLNKVYTAMPRPLAITLVEKIKKFKE